MGSALIAPLLVAAITLPAMLLYIAETIGHRAIARRLGRRLPGTRPTTLDADPRIPKGS